MNTPIWYYDAFAATLSLTTTLFGVLNNPVTWPLGLVTALASGLLYFNAGMLAHLAKETVQIFIMFYGWRTWTRKNAKSNQVKQIEEIDHSLFFIMLCCVLFVGFSLGSYLEAAFNSTSPYKDAVTTCLGIFGLTLTSRRILQCWLVWLLYDFISISLFLSIALYFGALKCSIYIIFASFGYWNWNRKMKAQPSSEPNTLSAA